ncbi:hypothetical protein GCM10012285_48530 [Streptomyces kronopolitis]|uniref:Uncharacterized protein n=1 Tax=Streptomyces kronopolitis TaxID=1612435 RepID=A0ABQ2JRI5_9ACTN|nr:hypothetical protein GCM10012285_48530 [Streptomyces kronopolitis]
MSSVIVSTSLPATSDNDPIFMAALYPAVPRRRSAGLLCGAPGRPEHRRPPAHRARGPPGTGRAAPDHTG